MFAGICISIKNSVVTATQSKLGPQASGNVDLDQRERSNSDVVGGQNFVERET